jgi:hypothetical protein
MRRPSSPYDHANAIEGRIEHLASANYPGAFYSLLCAQVLITDGLHPLLGFFVLCKSLLVGPSNEIPELSKTLINSILIAVRFATQIDQNLDLPG